MRDSLNSALKQISNNYYRIIKANLTEDTYFFLHYEEGEMRKNSVMGENAQSLSELWQAELRKGIILEDDRDGFQKYATMSFLKEFLAKYHGQEQYWIRYRKKTGGEDIPYRLEVLPGEDYSDDNQNVLILIKDLSGKMYEENAYLGELLKALSENYEAVFYVDFDKDRVKPYRVCAAIDEEYGAYFRTEPSYEAAMTYFIKAAVLQRDQAEMLEIAKPEYVRARLNETRAYSHEFRVVMNGNESCIRYKISNVDGVGTLHHAVVGFADISTEKRSSQHYVGTTKKILMVEHNEDKLRNLIAILGEAYSVVTAQDGREAMGILAENYDNIALVMTGLELPEMDGYELIRQMRNIRQYSDIPIIVTSAGGLSWENRVAAEVRSLEIGASDFLAEPYIGDVVVHRVKSLIRLRESTAMLHILEKDPLTGLYTKEFFFKKVDEYLTDHPDQKFVMWVSDISGLKVINEKYGLDKGDEVIKIMAQSGERNLQGYIFGGRIEGDKLAALVRENENLKIKSIERSGTDPSIFPVPNVVIKHGVYHIVRRVNLKPQGMYDRAMLALQKIKTRYGIYVAEYDDELRKDLLVKQLILGSADEALGSGQFQVYYQPKHNFHTDKTCGAEGLVRWQHPDLGFMNPAEFIPLFEQNGFITKMDFYIWNKVCQTIKEWERQGVPIVPVSINVSRRDFEVPDLAGVITQMVDCYEISREMIHVEVTESAYSDDPEKITKTVKQLHDNGFVIELDDFGTGYSSLIALSSMDLDIIKLDKSIIQNDMPGSEKNILEFSMQLAKMLKLKTVAEGVETKEQMQRICELGGDYIQGYYFSKPLPAREFAEYLRKKNL